MAQKRENIEVLRINPYQPKKGDSSLQAFATVRVGDVAISGITLVAGKNGLFISMPQEKGKGNDGKDAYFNTCWIDTGDKEDNKDLYDEIADAVIEAFKDAQKDNKKRK